MGAMTASPWVRTVSIVTREIYLVERQQFLDLVERHVHFVLGAVIHLPGHQHEHVAGGVGDGVHAGLLAVFLNIPEIHPRRRRGLHHVMAVAKPNRGQGADDRHIVIQAHGRVDIVHVRHFGCGDLLEESFLALDARPCLVGHENVVRRIIRPGGTQVGEPPLAEIDVESRLNSGLRFERRDNMLAHEFLEASPIAVDDQRISRSDHAWRRNRGGGGGRGRGTLEKRSAFHLVFHLCSFPC